jgi:hypothetical protein
LVQQVISEVYGGGGSCSSALVEDQQASEGGTYVAKRDMSCNALVEATICEDAECGCEMLFSIQTLFFKSLWSYMSAGVLARNVENEKRNNTP